MPVVLLHWKREEVRELSSRILGFAVELCVAAPGEGMRGLQEFGIPGALVLSLDRLPWHGRDIDCAFHRRNSARRVPLVCAGGDPAKAAKVRELLSEAAFASWDDVRGAIRRAIATPAAIGREARPAHQKIGLKAGRRIAQLGSPAPLEALAPGLPANIAIHESPSPETDRTLWFARSGDELAEGIAQLAPALGAKPRLRVFHQKGEGLTWAGISEAAAPHGLAQRRIMRLNDAWAGRARGGAA